MARTGNRRYRRRRARVLAPQRIWCHLCGEEIDKTLRAPHPLSASADHVHPVASGGSQHGALAPAHLICNSRRQALPLDEWHRLRREATTAPAADAAADAAPKFRW